MVELGIVVNGGVTALFARRVLHAALILRLPNGRHYPSDSGG